MITYAYMSIKELISDYNLGNKVTQKFIKQELKHRNLTIEECKIKYPEMFL